MTNDPKRIWLEPSRHGEHLPHRQWSIHKNTWYGPKATEYVRADLYAELEARLEAVRNCNQYMVVNNILMSTDSPVRALLKLSDVLKAAKA